MLPTDFQSDEQGFKSTRKDVGKMKVKTISYMNYGIKTNQLLQLKNPGYFDLLYVLTGAER